MTSTTQKGRDFFSMLRESKLDSDDEGPIEQSEIARLSTTVAVESALVVKTYSTAGYHRG